MSALDKLITTCLPVVPKPLVQVFARPYIAGERLEDQIRTTTELNHDGLMVTTAILGEFVQRREESEEAVHRYKEVLDHIEERKLDSTIHVKLSQLGLKLDKEFCYQNMRKILTHARERKNFVRMDMEDSSCIDDTLDIYFQLRKEFDNTGVVIQSRMRRSLADVRKLQAVQANVRLCKGIYLEPREIAFVDPQIIRNNYVMLLNELLSAGCYVGIATHDEQLIWASYQILDRLKLKPSQYEFQMLHGVDLQLRRITQRAGHRLRVSVSFGPNWYPYSLRRLRKNPAIAGYILKAMLRQP